MAEVEQKFVIGGPKTWQGWDNSVAIFTFLLSAKFRFLFIGVPY